MSETTSADADRLLIHNLVRDDARTGFADDVRRGLLARPKHLFPKYFYDPLGSELFEAICLLPEYYLTRAENEILTRYADDIAASLEGEKTLLEMGSGSAQKTRVLIEALLGLQTELRFIPVDISASALEQSARVLLQSYPRLKITAYAGDYYDGLAELRRSNELGRSGRTLALFLGSNIGNFDAAEAHTFLRALRGVLAPGDALLLGADLKKSREKLEAAYDDALGVTSAFNLNVLARINRELDADFNLRAFKHYVEYNDALGRVEVYAESLRAQRINIRKLGIEVDFQAGERIHTENSYKYDLDGLSELATATGFRRTQTWLDEREQFSSNLFMAAGESEPE